jgi:hypothetical protein
MAGDLKYGVGSYFNHVQKFCMNKFLFGMYENISDVSI